MNYDQWVSYLADLTVIPSTDSNFTTILPACRDYAEQRMYRELDLLATRVTDATTSFSSDNRNFTLPTATGTYLVVESLNAIVPASTPSTAFGAIRHPVTFTSREFIDTVYPSDVSEIDDPYPIYAAMVNNTAIIVGPPPNGAYVAEVIGTQRPTPLSSTNTTTILTTMLPDLFLAASMVFMSGYMRDFSAQGDNPQQGMSWESQYKSLFQSAQVEEVRKRYMSQAWTSQQPSPVATPPRV